MASGKDSYESYGMPSVRAKLIEQGVSIRRQRVARLKRLARIRGISRRRGFKVIRHLTDSGLVKRLLKSSGPIQIWVTDMTYVLT